MKVLVRSSTRHVQPGGRTWVRTVLSQPGLVALWQHGWEDLRQVLSLPDGWFLSESQDAADRAGLPDELTAWMIDLHRDADMVRALMYVQPELCWFAGHFPGRPLLPGVVQIDWAARLAAGQALSVRPFSGLSGIKFSSPVTPGTLLRLTLTGAASQRVKFSFETTAGICTRGTLHYRE